MGKGRYENVMVWIAYNCHFLLINTVNDNMFRHNEDRLSVVSKIKHKWTSTYLLQMQRIDDKFEVLSFFTELYLQVFGPFLHAILITLVIWHQNADAHV